MSELANISEEQKTKYPKQCKEDPVPDEFAFGEDVSLGHAGLWGCLGDLGNWSESVSVDVWRTAADAGGGDEVCRWL